MLSTSPSTLRPEPTPRTAEDVVAAITEQGVRYLFAQFVDMHGKPSAKLVPAAQVEALMINGAGFAGFAAGDIGQRPNDPDIIAIPDPTSYTRLPWPYCPRTILRNQLARAAAAGYELRVGAELEYFLLRRAEDGSLSIADPLDNQGQPCYDMRALTRSFDFVGTVADHLDFLGWDAYATDHEDANGQFEQNFGYAEALTTCDRSIFFRYMVESLAQERGLLATFMPKPFSHLTGNGCHLHLSLWSDGENVFADGDSGDSLGLSPLAYNFLGGLKEHASAYIGITAPTVNSYKRLVVGSQSGSAWAPIYISFGSNNRTQMLRIPDAGRIEDRTVDGSCNPYLAVTAILAAGLDGIERGLDPGVPTSELNLHEASPERLEELGVEMLPDNLLDATRELARDDVLRDAFGRCANEDYIDYFVRIKQEEWRRAQAEVSQWELERYLQLF